MTPTTPTVLYVEDDAHQRRLLRAILEHFGFDVMPAKSACDALEIAQWLPFEVALLDYELPGMNGTQLACEIRAVEPKAAIILLSGRDQLPAGELIYFDAHVVKGSPIDELVSTIFRLTGSRRWAESLPSGDSVSENPHQKASAVNRDYAVASRN
jgi:CheY-like chemotaxis protein